MLYKKFSLLFTAFAALTLLWRCGGDDSTCDIENPSIISNSPVTAGENIELSSSVIYPLATYYWTGPNGFVSHEPTLQFQSSAENAGVYTLSIGEGLCSSATATSTFVVNPITVPCNPANDTASNSAFASMNFYSVNAAVVQDHYEITCNSLTGDMRIIFANANIPTEGKYTICSSCPDSFMEPNFAGVTMVTNSTYCRAQPGDVYVRFIDGHISASFCDLTFSGGENTTFTSSAKVTDR